MFMRRFAVPAIAVLAAFSFIVCGSNLAAVNAGSVTPTTAWQNGSFNVDTASVVAQSNIILKAPNLSANQAMPLGNGNVGAALWSANGMVR
jgi:hypothetical protein